jgi:hypothetical protein
MGKIKFINDSLRELSVRSGRKDGDCTGFNALLISIIALTLTSLRTLFNLFKYSYCKSPRPAAIKIYSNLVLLLYFQVPSAQIEKYFRTIFADLLETG